VSTRDRTWESTAIFGEFGTVRHEVLRGNQPCVVEVGDDLPPNIALFMQVWKFGKRIFLFLTSRGGKLQFTENSLFSFCGNHIFPIHVIFLIPR